MSLRASEPVSRVALNTTERPSGENDGWLLVPLSLVSFTGVPALSWFPVHFRSTIHRLTGLGPGACGAGVGRYIVGPGGGVRLLPARFHASCRLRRGVTRC